jgi:thioesterase domain-containing protein
MQRRPGFFSLFGKKGHKQRLEQQSKEQAEQLAATIASLKEELADRQSKIEELERESLEALQANDEVRAKAVDA